MTRKPSRCARGLSPHRRFSDQSPDPIRGSLGCPPTRATRPRRSGAADDLSPDAGSHSGPNGAACVMEAVSYVAGEPWSDHPVCASPVVTRFLVRWNDAMNDDDRQMLKPYVPRLVGTRTGDADEETRAWMLTDWLTRECAPASPPPPPEPPLFGDVLMSVSTSCYQGRHKKCAVPGCECECH